MYAYVCRQEERDLESIVGGHKKVREEPKYGTPSDRDMGDAIDQALRLDVTS